MENHLEYVLHFGGVHTICFKKVDSGLGARNPQVKQ